MRNLSINVKDGVDIRSLRQEIYSRLMQIAAIFVYHLDEWYQFTITSGLDGTHKSNSRHYDGAAIDCRIWWINGLAIQQYPDDETLSALVASLQRSLGPDFDIVLHPGSHIHIEWDP